MIEEQYQAYLRRVGLLEAQLLPIQKQEIRRAFFGAWGQLLVCLEEDITLLGEDDAVRVLESMKLQVLTFFQATRSS